jgi:Domain of unknown function (DUF6457)
MNTLEEWTESVCVELGIADLVNRADVVPLVLDLARDVAHGVARPAAPLTAYLVGLAAGRAADPGAAVGELTAKVSLLAERWPA